MKPRSQPLMSDTRFRGTLQPGKYDAITDVRGVAVGHVTLIEGDGEHATGQGPVRTGVTVVLGRTDDVWTRPLFAGCHRLNGNGEVTGMEWLREAGQLGGPIALTSTYSVGLVRDTLAAMGVEHTGEPSGPWSLPVVGETWDGVLNDIEGRHVRSAHVRAAVAAAATGPEVEDRASIDLVGQPTVEGVIAPVRIVPVVEVDEPGVVVVSHAVRLGDLHDARKLFPG